MTEDEALAKLENIKEQKYSLEETYEQIRDDVRQAANKLKDKVKENSESNNTGMNPNSVSPNHCAGIIKAFDAREA